jgi:hypothetical protein
VLGHAHSNGAAVPGHATKTNMTSPTRIASIVAHANAFTNQCNTVTARDT